MPDDLKGKVFLKAIEWVSWGSLTGLGKTMCKLYFWVIFIKNA
jgi:hypothetical protein